PPSPSVCFPSPVSLSMVILSKRRASSIILSNNLRTASASRGPLLIPVTWAKTSTSRLGEDKGNPSSCLIRPNSITQLEGAFSSRTNCSSILSISLRQSSMSKFIPYNIIDILVTRTYTSVTKINIRANLRPVAGTFLLWQIQVGELTRPPYLPVTGRLRIPLSPPRYGSQPLLRPRVATLPLRAPASKYRSQPQ